MGKNTQDIIVRSYMASIQAYESKIREMVEKKDFNQHAVDYFLDRIKMIQSHIEDILHPHGRAELDEETGTVEPIKQEEESE